VFVRQVDEQHRSLRVGTAARRQPPEHGPDPGAREGAAGLGHTRGERRLDPCPLRRERRLPVLTEQAREPPPGLGRVREKELGQFARPLAVDGRAPEHRLADGGIVEHALAVLPAVVEERPAELLEQELRAEPFDPRELLLEALGRTAGARNEEVREVAAVEEGERVDPPPEPRLESAHATHPVVLQRVVLGVDEDVQAEDAFEQRRTRKGDLLGGMAG